MFKNIKLLTANRIKEILIIQAALDIIIVSEKKSYLRISTLVKKEKDIEIYKIDNGAGDHVIFLFKENETVILGFDHQSNLSHYNNEEIPVGYFTNDYISLMLNEEDQKLIDFDDVTFCLYNNQGDNVWKKKSHINYQNVDDGQEFLMGYLYDLADEWKEWAKDYYGDKFYRVEEIYLEVYRNKLISRNKLHKKQIELTAEEIKKLDNLGLLVN